MKKKIAKIICTTLALVVLILGLGVLSINLYMINYSKPYIHSEISSLPDSYTVIIPGAKVFKNTVSHVVRDRIEAAVNCLKSNKAQRALISGDHGRVTYDEVNQMRLYMMNIYGVDGENIFMDHAGFSTYETMYRARDIFCVKDAVVVSQKFHLARCVYIARKMGLDVVGYEAPVITPFAKRTLLSWDVRESLARVKAFFYVMFNKKPKFLGEKIPITGDSTLSWD